MSIKTRLIITITLLLAAGILGMTGAVVLDGAPRAAEESASTARLTETLIRSSLVALENAHDPKATLERLVANLATLRHVHVSLESKAGEASAAAARPSSILWSGMTGGAPPVTLEIPVHVKDELVDVLLVTPIPEDEWREVWGAIGRIFEYGVILAVLLTLLTSVLINRSLEPIGTLTRALHELEDGNFAVKIPESGPPEIADSCRQLNLLAKALSTSRARVTELSARIVQVQDEERREVVRELHDDLGPHIFALRARASALERQLLKETPDLDRAIEDATGILEHVDAVQQTNRRVLHRLVPPGLLELGLERALSAMAAAWRKEQPHISLHVALPRELARLGESASLTIYRVCQEALTNAYRHAGATAIDLEVALTPSEAGSAISIRVSDNGRGLPTPVQLGRGLEGMRERVVALGGTLGLRPNEPSGLVLCVDIPA